MTALVESETGTVLRSIEIAQRQETRDAWELADAIYEDVLELMPGVVVTAPSFGESGVNTGVHAAQEQVYEAHRKAGTDVGRTYVRAMFATVRVWPEEERLPELASFVVHAELRGKAFPNRRQIIQRLAANSTTGRATWVNLRRWKSEQKPGALKTFQQLFEERVRGAAFRAGKPWNHVTEADRFVLAAVCRDIADEIEAGTFGL